MVPKSYEELVTQVGSQGDIAVFEMGVLRDLEGAGKLGKYIRQSISDTLRTHHLGHLPEDLPIYQEQAVRIYRLESRVGRVVEAILHPSAAGDAVLRALGDDDDAQERLEQIRRVIES